ncbi:hypothetical protein [Methanogenium sp. MK-MG]|uniref:hypothetical protein n=1 Tax=Methanogenium sp. MK-MG TaxID=2599926 RepID=UPI0013ED79AB|nr:hypothetical protein [Methanogenium sp. MK-MG]KAF1078027.1 hypothetical protein MKMG_01068 [Methanogenium sp. MK-MG]
MNPNPMPRWHAAAAILLVLCLFVPAAAAGSWVTETVSPSDPEPIAADISGSHVVYSVAYGEAINLSTPRGLLLYDADTGRTTTIANASGQMTLTGGEIAGDAVVWFEEPQGFTREPTGLNNSILLFSLATSTTTAIRTSPSAEWPKTDGHRIIWSETPGDTYITSLSLYDIAAKTTGALPVHPEDGASVVLDSDTIAFRDANTSALSLYDIPSQQSTAVTDPIHTNTTDTMVDAYALGGDVLLYKTRIVEYSPPNRGITNILTRYSVKNKTNVTLSPITGRVVENPTADDLKASFDSLFTDGETISWVVETGISESVVITVSAETGDVSRLEIDGDVAFPSVDGSRATWVQSKMFKNAHLVLAAWQDSAAAGNTTGPVAETTSAPGFGILCAAGALAVVSLGRKK